MQSSGRPQASQANPTTLSVPASSLSLIAGALIEVIAGINFYLYSRASRQMAAYHICLERTNRFLLVNTLFNEMGDNSNETRARLIETMLNAPMLTIAQATGEVGKPSKNEPDEVGEKRANHVDTVHPSNGKHTVLNRTWEKMEKNS